jgi:hypothetical protein
LFNSAFLAIVMSVLQSSAFASAMPSYIPIAVHCSFSPWLRWLRVSSWRCGGSTSPSAAGSSYSNGVVLFGEPSCNKTRASLDCYTGVAGPTVPPFSLPDWLDSHLKLLKSLLCFKSEKLFLLHIEKNYMLFRMLSWGPVYCMLGVCCNVSLSNITTTSTKICNGIKY